MSGIYLRRHGTALDDSTPGSLKIRIKLRQAGSDAFATDSHWTPASGDVLIVKDFGAPGPSNIDTLPSFVNGWWEFTLSSSELSAKQVMVTVEDPAIVPEAFMVETFGSITNATYSNNWSGANAHAVTTNDRVLTALPDATPGVSGGLPALELHGVMDPAENLALVAMPTGLFESLERLNAVCSTNGLQNPINTPGDTGGLALATDNGVLTISQNDNVELIDDIKAKTDLLKSGANVQFPFVSASGTIVLFEGFDATSTGNAAVEVTESEPGEWDDTRIALGGFRFYMRSQETDDDLDVEASLETGGSAEHTLSADILSVDLPSHVGLYDWYFYATAPGTGSDEEGEFPIVYGTLELRRGKASACP